MAAHFELIDAQDGGYRLRLLDGNGELVAESVRYPTKQAATAGLGHSPEITENGFVLDCCSSKRRGQGRPKRDRRQEHP